MHGEFSGFNVMKTTFILILHVLGLLTLLVPASAQTYQWPAIVPIAKTFEFPEAERARAELRIVNSSGEAAYVLRCIGSDLIDEYLEIFEYTGDFECSLTSLYSEDHYGTLLTENPRQEHLWESRGRFFWSELTGVCGQYSEYNTTRHFRLRGMELKLQITDMQFNPPDNKTDPEGHHAMKSFRFSVSAKPDMTALSAIAEPVPFEPQYLDKKPWCGLLREKHVAGRVTKKYIQKNALEQKVVEVRPASKTRVLPGPDEDFRPADVRLLGSDIGFYMPIRDHNKRVVYEFECTFVVPIVRWGISCGLFAAGKKINLLEDSTDPYSRSDRGSFFPEQLMDKCADYPDWGATRVYRLRGFRLVIRLTNPKFIPSDYDWYGKGLVGEGLFTKSQYAYLGGAAILQVAFSSGSASALIVTSLKPFPYQS
jgi:hypothetical protein